jgi:hypothetical protein
MDSVTCKQYQTLMLVVAAVHNCYPHKALNNACVTTLQKFPSVISSMKHCTHAPSLLLFSVIALVLAFNPGLLGAFVIWTLTSKTLNKQVIHLLLDKGILPSHSLHRQTHVVSSALLQTSGQNLLHCCLLCRKDGNVLDWFDRFPLLL